MRRSLWVPAYALILLASITATAAGQRVHRVRLEANPDKEIYRFNPDEITARPGDVLLFRVASGPPHSIVFEAAGLTEGAREALNGAMARRTAELSSPLLTSEGAEYRVVVPQLLPGTYSFFCLPHRAYDMRGQLRVVQ